MRNVRTLLIMTTVISTVGAAAGQNLFDRFFDEYYFPDNPTTATASGVHKYDGELEDYSSAGVVKRIAKLKGFESEFAKLPATADRDLVLSNIRAGLLELESVKMWERNPDVYSSGISSSAFTIMSRTYALPDVRLKALISREKKMPKVLMDARANLKNPPKMYTEIALEQLPGIQGFFEHDVPLAFKDVKDQKLLKDFDTSNKAVIAALKDYEKWLKSDLLAKSNGDYKLGADKFAKKLQYEEMVDVPLDRLLQIGYANLRENQQKFKEVAAKIDPKKTPREILTEMEKDHPAPDKLLDAFRDQCVKLRDYIEAHKIVTIPSKVLPILEETPPFARALTIASMDTPGPYEEVAKEAFFNVTLPEKDWPKDRVEDYMKGFHKGLVLSVAVHEAYPGHYIQFLWMQHVDSRVRKLLGASSNAEGWAHYSEQMMLDEGYANGDLKMRLGQLQDALLRNVRFIVGIEMHTGKRSFEDCVTAFEKEGYQPHEVALKEAKRGTSDPTYLYYTLGKLQILKLREDYKKKMGAEYSLAKFHDEFLKQGFPPIKIVRKAMLGDDSPTL
jgi:uncharacterized protein (DUF885 family)